MTRALKSRAYCMTRRMTRALRIARAPSLNATAPASCNRPISAISAPSRPAVRAAKGSTRTRPVSRARRKRKSAPAASSTGGLVSGRARTVVIPPAAAAKLAVAIVSRCSAPGSPMNAHMSMRPGATQSPPQSMIRAWAGRFAGMMAGPKSRITPSTTRTPPMVSRSSAGSISRALTSASGWWATEAGEERFTRNSLSSIGQMLRKRLQYGDPHRDPHLDLLADEAPWPVGDDPLHFDPAVHRSRVQDKRIRLGITKLCLVEAEEAEIFLGRGNIAALHPLALQAQHHHDVGAVEPRPHVPENLDPHPLDSRRQQRRWPGHAHPRAERREQQNIGARDTRMKDVAADHDREPFDPALVAPDRERIEQRLGWMLMRAIARVDDRAIDLFRQKMDRAGLSMAHHDNVGPHRVQRHRRIDQRLALLYARGCDRHVHDVAAKTLAGQFEGRLGPGRSLEKKIDQSPSAQGRALFLDLARHFDRRLGEIEKKADVLRGKPFDPEQMPVGKCGLVRRVDHRPCSIGRAPAPAR